MATSKSALRVLRTAYLAAERALPPYSCPKSKHLYTQAQLIACLVLKEFLQQDYRGIVALLGESPQWREAIGLRLVPHFTTLQKAEQRLLKAPFFEALLNQIVAEAQGQRVIKKRVKLAAIDGSGLETHHASRYYTAKKQAFASKGKAAEAPRESFSHFPFYVSLCDCHSHLVLAAWVGEGPTYETSHLPWLLRQACRRTGIDTLLGDAGYDSEKNHVFCREKLGVTSIFPPTNGRNKHVTTPPRGRYRRRLWQRFDKQPYRQRPQVETFNSMLKHRLGSFLRARRDDTRRLELRLRLFAIDAMIV